MRSFYGILLLTTLFPLCFINAQNSHRIMTYNLLNYPGSDTTTRNPYFRTIISNTDPDVIVVQEITSLSGVNGFLNNVILSVIPGFQAGVFIDGPDTDNAIFFKSSIFSFISNYPVKTALRDINEFTMRHNSTGDTLRIYSVHLKASSGTSNELLRAAEVDSLRKRTNALPVGSKFMIVGDYNIYRSTESAYIKLLDQTGTGYILDPLTLVGTWNNSAFAIFHTQSPRVRQFGGGATGGMDDRFDMILMSQSVMDSGGISFSAGSYTAYGNDGNHFNDSINRPPNNAVTMEIANALHYASDHLPVYADFEFENAVPVEFFAFSATLSAEGVLINWSTASELNNYGFEVLKKNESAGDWQKIVFVPGSNFSSGIKEYSTFDSAPGKGKINYRLKQIDLDGSYNFSKMIEITNSDPLVFKLSQNYPNPFNPSTTIGFEIPYSSHVTLKIFDVLGNEIHTLADQEFSEGNYQLEFDASDPLRGGAGLASGMYFYQLQFGSKSFIKKMLYLK